MSDAPGVMVERGDGWIKVHRVPPEAADRIVAAIEREVHQVGREVPHDSLVSGRYYWWKGEERMPWQPVFVRPGERRVIFGTHCNAWDLLFGEFREMPVPDDKRTVAGKKS